MAARMRIVLSDRVISDVEEITLHRSRGWADDPGADESESIMYRRHGEEQWHSWEIEEGMRIEVQGEGGA